MTGEWATACSEDVQRFGLRGIGFLPVMPRKNSRPIERHDRLEAYPTTDVQTNRVRVAHIQTCGATSALAGRDDSFRVLQGGMFAQLSDIAGQQAAHAATGKTMRTADMEIHYLSQGKVGPFQTRTSILRMTKDTVLTRIEVIDRGADENLIAVATNLLADFSSF